ncbi:MAG TPA: TIGR03560 family F420-dependent LLM class oxidoreductase [Ktedonobacterales bacterium]|nr:TIGR03560 family F420-dependent LLM class oxidoreductase [Ktedonobacterales bacterium]
MPTLSIMIEGQNGLTWRRWQRLVAEVERLGFAGLFRSDHFTNMQPPDKESLELVVSLAYLADHTQRIHFGPLVAPFSFRDPALLARQAAALDDLSGGRLILGVGAGWQEREHMLFGYPLLDVPARMRRLEEGLEVVTRLLQSDEPVSYEGQFYHLRGATLLPRPQQQGGPPILIGGTGMTRTLPLVARYATYWNASFISPEAFRERSVRLDELLRAAGRSPEDVQRSLMLTLTFARSRDELEQRLASRRRRPELAGKSLDEVVAALHAAGSAIVGTPMEVVSRIRDYAAAGVQELMLQWLDLDDLDGLRALADTVLPQIEQG